MHGLWKDLTVGARAQRQAPAATAAIVLTLAFGIAANTTTSRW